MTDATNPDQPSLRERLAAIEHERWAHWQCWMHLQCLPGSQLGSLVIPAELVLRWTRQMGTPYAELSEAEKDSDREQVDRYWSLIEEEISAAKKSGYRKAIAVLEARFITTDKGA